MRRFAWSETELPVLFQMDRAYLNVAQRVSFTTWAEWPANAAIGNCKCLVQNEDMQNAPSPGTDWKVFSGFIGVVVGWLLSILTRHFEQIWFGAKLKIDFRVPGNKDENATDVYIRFHVQNVTEHRVAKSCRAYLVELHKMSKGKVVSENLLPDSFQLPWAGYSYDARDIPAKASQYVDLVHFSKEEQGWIIVTKPWFRPRSTRLRPIEERTASL